MRAVIALLAYLVYLTLGTYAVPGLRMELGTWALPYAVPLVAGLAVFGFLEFLVRPRGGTQAERMLAKWTWVYLCATLLSLMAAIKVDTELTVKCLLMASFPLAATLARPGAVLCRRCVVLLGVSSLAVLMYGVYGYVTWSVGDPLQHTLGYLGVTYMQSTRNGDSLYFQTLLWIALGGAMWYRGRPWLRVTLFVVVLGSVVAATLSFSRGAWIAVALTPLILYVVVRKPSGGRRSAALVAICLCAAVLLGGSFFSETMQERVRQRASTLTAISLGGGNSNAARVEIVEAVLPIIVQHPLFGVGYANLRYYFPQRVGLYINHAENTYLQAFAEQGLIALVSFVGLLAWTIKGLLRLISVGEKRREWAAMVLLALVIDFYVFSVFNDVLDNMWFWSVMALAAMYICAPSRSPVAIAPGRPAGPDRMPLRSDVLWGPIARSSTSRVNQPSLSSLNNGF